MQEFVVLLQHFLIIYCKNLRHGRGFVPKVGEIGWNRGIYSMRKWLDYNHFCMGVFFRKKFSCAESCAEG